MAATTNEERRRAARTLAQGQGGNTGTGSTGGSSKKSSTGNVTMNLATAALSAMSPEMLLDLVGRLGLTEMVVSQVRSRIERIDMDEVFDDAADYLRRYPEVIVALLGATTIAAAAIVYLARIRDWDDTKRAGGERSSGGGRSRASRKG
jgi:hypothetical protein